MNAVSLNQHAIYRACQQQQSSVEKLIPCGFEVEHISRNNRHTNIVVYHFKIYFLQSSFTYN